MIIGYWDQRSTSDLTWKYLFPGSAATWPEEPDPEDPTGTARMVASLAHIVAGSENGYAFGDWHNSTSYPNHQSNLECVADFMRTENAGTALQYMGPGLVDYCAWDDPQALGSKSYAATSATDEVPYDSGAWTYSAYKSEIDAGRPVLLGMGDPEYINDELVWHKHSIVGYGYKDDMFKVKVIQNGGGTVDLTLGGMAVRDTWLDEQDDSVWVGWQYQGIVPIIEDGVEWWPFIEKQCSGAWNWGGAKDWMVLNGTTLEVAPWLIGDANHTDVCDVSDLSLLAGHFRQTTGVTWEDGDFNGDGAVDVSDLSLLAGHFR